MAKRDASRAITTIAAMPVMRQLMIIIVGPRSSARYCVTQQSASNPVPKIIDLFKCIHISAENAMNASDSIPANKILKLKLRSNSQKSSGGQE